MCSSDLQRLNDFSADPQYCAGKIPVASDIPEQFHVHLFDGRNIKPTPYNIKATGEPPLMLGLSVFFALKDAVGAVRPDRTPVPLVSPATPERLLLATRALRAA